MHTDVFRRCSEGCRNNEPNQLVHLFCNEIYPRAMANDCFDVVFSKLYIFLDNEFCFGTVGLTIPIPVRDVDLYTSRERLLKSSE